MLDFTGCVFLKRFEKEILQGMDVVQFLKPENKDWQMRISTDEPNGVKFMLGLGNGMTVYGVQSLAEYECKKNGNCQGPIYSPEQHCLKSLHWREGKQHQRWSFLIASSL